MVILPRGTCLWFNSGPPTVNASARLVASSFILKEQKRWKEFEFRPSLIISKIALTTLGKVWIYLSYTLSYKKKEKKKKKDRHWHAIWLTEKRKCMSAGSKTFSLTVKSYYPHRSQGPVMEVCLLTIHTYPWKRHCWVNKILRFVRHKLLIVWTCL